ncbi:hypothetical protein EMCRGX_G032790 [Ephydatia muelleri]
MQRSETVKEVNGPVSSPKVAFTHYSYTALKLAACNFAGIVFGIATEKGKVYAPSVIRGQMLFNQFTMVKVFLSAVATGSCCFVVLAALPQTRKLFSYIQEEFVGGVNKRQTAAFVIGGGITGSGHGSSWSVSWHGYTTGVQWNKQCMDGDGWLFLGSISLWFEIWLHSTLGLPFIPTAIAFASTLGAVTVLLEYLYPWQNETVMSGGGGYLSQIAWSPIVAGVMMGCMQIPVVLTVNAPLGSSRSYCAMLSCAMTPTGLSHAVPYFKKFYSGIGNWWQVIFWAGAGLGAALSAYLSSSWGTLHNSTPLVCLVGGTCLVFGARFAQGCTSGHGLSGMALLSLPSFAAVCAMFAGGIGTSLLLQSFHYEL